MSQNQQKKSSYSWGIAISLFIHVFFAACGLINFDGQSSTFVAPPSEIFSVTLEGGEKLGGISQVPQVENAGKAPLAPLINTDKEPVPEHKEEPQEAKELKIESPTAIEDDSRIREEEERKRKEALEKAEKEKKLAEEKKKKEEKEKAAKEKAEAEKKAKEKAEKEAKEKAEAEKKAKEAREKELKKALESAKSKAESASSPSKAGAKSNYLGESANAGGEGFGAAKLGGQGMGGGTQANIEFIAYRNALEKHIKSGWYWISGTTKLTSTILIKVEPSGRIESAVILASSGNKSFDESVLRAVVKSSPVPEPPVSLYSQFKEVRITFDSADN